jgi:uncharacterized protein
LKSRLEPLVFRLKPRFRTRNSIHNFTHRSITAEQWGRFLITIFDEWVRRDVGKVFVQLFDSSLGAWVGQGASLCIHRPTCGDALALEHNGDLYSSVPVAAAKK